MSHTRLLAFLASLVVLGSSSLALAWDSICTEYVDARRSTTSLGEPTSRGCEGIAAAHGRWRDPDKNLDEHRILLHVAFERAGLSDDAVYRLTRTSLVPVVTDGRDVSSSACTDSGCAPAGTYRSLAASSMHPILASLGTRAELRAFSIDELAQLPDFAWSLTDFANGMEDCPPDLPGSPWQCHAFATHMGALNSSHFPPESRSWYEHLHGLAISAAEHCHDMRRTAWDAAPATGMHSSARMDYAFRGIYTQCELEAMALEAVAQHYLADSYSSGHMWRRWGYPELGEFPLLPSRTPLSGASWNALPEARRRLVVAELIAAAAGTIHGMGPVNEASGRVFGRGADAICYPHRDAAARTLGSAASSRFAVGGDDHVHDILAARLSDASFMEHFGDTNSAVHARYGPYFLTPTSEPSALTGQFDAMVDCAARSIWEVYSRLADPGGYGDPAHGEIDGPAPSASACDDLGSHRVDNATFASGFNDENWVAISDLVAIENIPNDIETRRRMDYRRAREIARALAAMPGSRHGTEMAELAPTATTWTEEVVTEEGTYEFTRSWRGGTVPFLGVCPNGQVPASGAAPASLDESDLDPTCVDRPAAARPASYADAPWPWLDGAGGLPSSEVEPLVSMFQRAHADHYCAAFGGLSGTRPRDMRDATRDADTEGACAACVELVSRLVRVNGAPSFCDLVVPGTPGVTATGDDVLTAAESYCHCDLADAYLDYCPVAGGGGAGGGGGGPECAETPAFGVLTDAGVAVVGDFSGVLSVERPATPVGSNPRDIAVGTAHRVFVTNGDGEVVGLRIPSEATVAATELDMNGSAAGTRLALGSDLRGIAFFSGRGSEWLLVVDGATDTLHVLELGSASEPEVRICGSWDVGRDPSRSEGAWDVVVTGDGAIAIVSFRGLTSRPGDTLAIVDLVEATRCDTAPRRSHVFGFGSGSGLGAMDLSPDGTRLAVAGRFRSTCPDQVYSNTSGSRTDVQVGCDSIWILPTATLDPAGPSGAPTLLSVGARNSMPTRPLSYPYAVAWHPDSRQLAWASFSSTAFDPWPRYAPMASAGAIRMGDTAAGTWTYNLPLDGSVVGEAVAFAPTGDRVYVGTNAGTLYSIPVTPEIWRDSEADPESLLHDTGSLFGNWYGGCRYSGSCPGGYCPTNCTGAGLATDMTTISVGSRILAITQL